MDPYDPKLVPKPFGLNNTGALCYFNSFLQILAGCTSFTRQVLKNRELMDCTITGRAVYQFCDAYAVVSSDGAVVARQVPVEGIEMMSSKVFEALFADIRTRRPRFELSTGQDDVRMLVDMFVDMLEVTAEGKDSRTSATENAVTQLFLHKYNLTTRCRSCKRAHNPPPEGKMAVFVMTPQRRRAPPTNPAEFAGWVRRAALWNEDYRCEGCLQKSTCVTEYNLAIVPEILICTFNLKTDEWMHTHSVTGEKIIGKASGERVANYFPERLEFPAIGGGTIGFRLIGQAEHSGGNNSGHYWARGLRDGGVCRLNDYSVSADSFGPSAETYLIAYHYDGYVPPISR